MWRQGTAAQIGIGRPFTVEVIQYCAAMSCHRFWKRMVSSSHSNQLPPIKAPAVSQRWEENEESEKLKADGQVQQGICNRRAQSELQCNFFFLINAPKKTITKACKVETGLHSPAGNGKVAGQLARGP